MRLYTNCTNCSKEIRFSSWTSDRVELSKTKGDKIKLTCNQCGKMHFYHVNNIHATESKTAQLIGFMVFIIGTPLAFYFIWDYVFRFSYSYVIAGLIGLIGIPFAIYSVINNEQRKKIRAFNNYRISE